MRRTLRIGAGFILAFLIVTCTDKSVTGLRERGTAVLNLSAFQSTPSPGKPDIPIDSVRVVLDRIPLSGAVSALDTVIRFTPAPDTLTLDVNVSLNSDPENFQLTVLAYGGGTVWYRAVDTTAVSSGKPATPQLTAQYVGPGAGATSVTLAPRDTTVTGGQTIPLRVTVDSGATAIPNVPVGILSGDTTKGKVSQPTYTTGSFVGKSGIRDSVWLYVETPTHLRDSTRIHIVPPPSQIVKFSGDSQSVIVNGAIAAPLTVRVEDALNGGSPGVSVAWAVTQGSATFSPASPIVSDTGGYARMTVTPTSLGTVKVQATAAGLTGSPVTFTVNVLAGIVHQVIVAPKVDTVAKGVAAQFTATLKDSLGNVVTTVKPVWTSSNSVVATVDSTGLATTLAGDSTYIVAAAGGFADTARLYVRAPAKVVLTPSDTVITSIGDSVHLTGVVLTNFGDTVKTATVIRFASTTPSVATVNAVTGEALAVGAGNGVVLATDTISKVTGTATLRVNQKVFGIVNSPPDSLEVGVNGQAQILATATDKHGHPIPGKVFGWITRVPATATVNQSGVVTGLAVGAKTYAVDSLIDSVTVFKDSTLVSVVLAPPPVMRWAFDTLAIGNGGNTTVNVSLNTPSVAGTVMQIVSADTTRVKPTQNRIVIGTSGASASVTLQGLAATLTPVNVVAQDSAGIYAPDTLRVIVVSTIFFAPVGQTTRTQDFYLNENETLNAQVFLSDPAPAGGLGVTFIFTKGFSSITPTTVIIPQGQLAAPVQFLGTGVGTDSVIPSSGAFAGKFSYLHVAANNLTAVQPYPYTGAVGLGQYEQVGAQITYGMDHVLPFTATIAPSPVATTQSPDTILINNGSRYFNVTGTALGAGTLTLSATNWVSSSIPVVVTTPKLQVNPTTSIIAGAPPSAGYWYAYTEDSLTYQHPVSAPVHVTAVSRDTTVLKVLVDTLTVPVGNSSWSVGNSLQAQPGAGGDSTYLVITAPGYRSDSIIIHVTKPTLTSGLSYPYDGRVPLNTHFQNAAYIQIQYARTDTFWVLLSHTRKGLVGGVDSVAIFKGQTTGYFDTFGDTLGIDSVTITRATGYVLPTAPQFIFTVDSLHVRPSAYPSTLYNISTPSAVNVAAFDPVDGQYHPLIAPLRVNVGLNRAGVVSLDSAAVTIPAGQYYSNYDTLRVVGVDTVVGARILSTAPGSTPDSSGVIKVYASGLTLGLGYPYAVARGLRLPSNYVQVIGGVVPNSLTVTLTHTAPTRDSLAPTSVIIPKGSSTSAYYTIFGLDSTGTDTITATASGFVSGRTTISPQRASLYLTRIGTSQLTTAPPYTLYAYTEATGYQENPVVPVTITYTSSSPTVVAIDSGAAVNGTEDTVTALVDSSRSYSAARIRFVGPGTAFIRITAPGFAKDSIGPIAVTGPSLSINPASTTVGVGQYITGYVYTQNSVASPVGITLQRADSSAPPASQLFTFDPATLTIATGQNSSNTDTIFGQNIGAGQLLATAATGYGPASATIQVGQPRLSAPANLNLLIGSTPSLVTVYTQDQASNYRQVAAATTVSTTITDPAVLAVDSVQRVVAAHQGNTTSFQFSALKKGAVQTVFSAPGYKPDTMLVTVDTGTLNLLGTPVLAVGQTYQAYLSVPFNNVNAVVVTLNSTNPSVLSVPATVTIPAGQTAVNFFYTGTGIGSAQVTASAPGLHPSPTVGTIVTAPHVTISITLTNNAGQAEFFSVYTTDSTGNAHGVVSPVVVHLSSSAGAHATFQTDSVVIPAGNAVMNDYVTFDTGGAYSVSGSATGYVTGTTPLITVSGVEVKVGVGNALTFTPGTVTAPVNNYATWVWDPTNTNSHGVHWLTAPASLPSDSPTQSSGSYSVYFTTPGTYTYQCILHGAAMPGTIVVQ